MIGGNTLGGSSEELSCSDIPFSLSTIYGSPTTTFDNSLEVNHSGPDGSVKKRRLSKIMGGGLRDLSVIVCTKVESKGRSTYSEVADEIIAEYPATSNTSKVSLNEFDEKNIRRRVYDALNVLMALDIITKDKKEIRWKGFPSSNVKDIAETEALHVKLMTRVAKKAAYLKDLEEEIAGLQKLMLRNQPLLNSETVPSGGFYLPFILVQTTPQATVEIEISEDMQLVHFDFNSTPFTLHDDAYIIRLMHHQQLQESRNVSRSPSVQSSSSSNVDSGRMKPFYWNSEVDTLPK